MRVGDKFRTTDGAANVLELIELNVEPGKHRFRAANGKTYDILESVASWALRKVE